MKNKIIVLAYSGGLDTSFCIPYLKDEKGYEVHAVNVNTSIISSAEKKRMASRAKKLGAAKFEMIDIADNFYDDCLRYLIYGNMLRNDTYPMSVSSERAFQALAILKYVKSVKAKYVAHGSTGAGNDQIRFDIIFQSMAPNVKIVTPIRDHSFSRQYEVDYLKSKGFEWSEQKKNYSINEGIWGTSVGGKETLTSHLPLPEEAYPTELSRSKPKKLTLEFKKGEITKIDGKVYKRKIELIHALNKIASKYAIGRDVHVGDTIVGIKGRVAFEASAALILIKAHQLLEKHTLSKWQAHWKKQLADWYGMQLHEGLYLEPVMRQIETFLEESQKNVTGKVFLKLHPYRFELLGIESKHDLMKAKFGQYGENNTLWSAEEAKGFIKLLSVPNKIFYSVNK